MSATPQEQAAAAALEDERLARLNPNDNAEIEAYFAGWRRGNGYDDGVEPTYRDYDDWKRGVADVVLPKLWVRCDRPGMHPEHQRDTDIDGQLTTVICSGEAREEDLQW